MADLLERLRHLNGLGGYSVAEPFAGGAGASLGLLYREMTRDIVLNDLDGAIFSFWWALLNRTQSFLELLATTPVSVDEWRRQREVYRSRSRISRLRRGFATFYLNRCNRSGIVVTGGPVGGVEQGGKWKINARFNKTELSARCQRLGEYRDRIRLANVDGIEFIRDLDLERTFVFIDPPYFQKGPSLYLNAIDGDYHGDLAKELRKIEGAAWVLTYDDCPEIRRHYEGWAQVRPFSLRYAAAERRGGKEVLVAPRWMRLPEQQSSMAISW